MPSQAANSAPQASAPEDDGPFEHNVRTKALLKRIDDQRKAIHKRLLESQVCFFGTSYATANVPARLARKLIDILPEAIRDAADGSDLFARLRAKGYTFIGSGICDDLIANRQGYLELIERRRKMEEDEAIQKMIDKSRDAR